MGVNFQQSYNLGNDYGDIRDRATQMLGNYMEYDNLIKFNDIDRSVTFITERLFPIKSSKRPKIMLLFSNPHPHSIQQGMFLSSNTKNRENLFWPTMRDAGWFSFPESKQNSSQRKDMVADTPRDVSNSIVPPSWPTNACTICSPRDPDVFAASKWSIPTPLSLTTSCNSDPSEIFDKLIHISPEVSSENACFTLLVSSSFNMRPHGTAWLIPRLTSSNEYLTEIRHRPAG